MIHTTFYLRRMHSLVGLVAVGIFLLEHIFTNATVMRGPEAFNNAMAMMELIPKPIFYGLEIFAIALPLLFHMLYGMHIAAQAKNNPLSYGFLNNWQFALQRWTAWLLVPFLIWHVGYLRIYLKGITGTPISYELLQQYFVYDELAIVHSVLYTVCMIAAIFHFCNGITTFCMTWGIAKGSRIQMMINAGAMGLCALLSLITVAFMVSYFII